jgi:hypothetical protein
MPAGQIFDEDVHLLPFCLLYILEMQPKEHYIITKKQGNKKRTCLSTEKDF